MKFEVVIVEDTAPPLLKKVRSQIGPNNRANKRLMSAAGAAVLKVFRDHFRKLENDTSTKRAQRGWPKQHFWTRRVLNATRLSEVTRDRATISIASREFIAKVYGADIRPGPGKQFLTIPLRGEVYGKRAAARPVPGLFFVRSKRTRRLYLASRDGQRLKLWYRLVKMVRLKPFARALPPDRVVSAHLEAALLAFVVKLQRQGGGGGP
ncbi:MAG: hypothetical protein ACFBZ8_13010 [Opitutales bacterium]